MEQLESLKKELQDHLGTPTKVQRCVNFIRYQKKQGDRKLSEQSGLFAPYKDAPAEEYEVADMDIDTYEALQDVYMQSANVANSDKQKIADEMGWKLEEFDLNKLKLKDHYYAVAETILKDFTPDRDRVLKMAVINRAAAFFSSGQR